MVFSIFFIIALGFVLSLVKFIFLVKITLKIIAIKTGKNSNKFEIINIFLTLLEIGSDEKLIIFSISLKIDDVYNLKATAVEIMKTIVQM